MESEDDSQITRSQATAAIDHSFSKNELRSMRKMRERERERYTHTDIYIYLYVCMYKYIHIYAHTHIYIDVYFKNFNKSKQHPNTNKQLNH